ncbi:MAG: hypothetical protein EOO88_39875 [Pedobacter sp.]|nr:MAG: hypothetical protein EOO88_39875 [Pedobacter sp.]
MGKLKNLLAGLAGAIALNVLHEGLRKKSNEVPRVDLLGEEALQKTLGYFGTQIEDEQTLYTATLAGDIVSNALYYSLIAAGDKKYLWPKAVFFGLSAGIGAIKLPKPMGLNPEPVAETSKKQVLTVGYYLFGAIVTALVVKSFKK